MNSRHTLVANEASEKIKQKELAVLILLSIVDEG